MEITSAWDAVLKSGGQGFLLTVRIKYTESNLFSNEIIIRRTLCVSREGKKLQVAVL